MRYCVIENGMIQNIIVCKDDAAAEMFDARPYYDGAEIGGVYAPVKPPAQLREEAYNTQAIIEWDGDMLTVTQAAQKWQYYAAEGNTAKTDDLTSLIAEAKASIREQYPDEEAEQA